MATVMRTAAEQRAMQEQREVIQDAKEGVLRTVVVPAAYSVEEFIANGLNWTQFRLRRLKLTEPEVGYGSSACALLSKRLVSVAGSGNARCSGNRCWVSATSRDGNGRRGSYVGSHVGGAQA